jgi:AcrR family transcriptional regulator
MSKEERRDQLLDAAARLLLEQGPAGMTMERLAEWSGVSKALPYQHFENAEQVQLALYERETSMVGTRIWEALLGAAPDDDLVILTVHTYFDWVQERGEILTAVAAPGSPVRAAAERNNRSSVTFTSMLLERFHGLPRERARAIAGPMLGAMVGGSDAWGAGYGDRDAIESAVVTMFRSLLPA